MFNSCWKRDISLTTISMLRFAENVEWMKFQMLKLKSLPKYRNSITIEVNY